MSKIKKHYSCTNCGSISSKWAGQCYDCGSWGSIIEEAPLSSKVFDHQNGNIQKLEQLNSQLVEAVRTPTKIAELNRVLGGGLVAASVTLIGGDPGIGKSTLLLQLAASLASANLLGCLYITGEESVEQIKLRASRLNINNASTNIVASANIEDIISTLEAHKKQIEVVIIDSIQTMSTSLVASPPGTVSQIRACSLELINYSKQNNIILLLACHVTKDGQLAGPKLLEHMVDTVLYFESDYNHHFRILRSIKNRFGSVNEIGVFEMGSSGLSEISNPSELFLMQRDSNVSGSAIFAGIEGSRPLLIEVQALIAPSHMATPRRSVVGWDPNRLSMIIAVLNVRFGLNLASFEVYLTIAGGLRISEPAADLAVAAALISAAKNTPTANHSVFFGEIGLSGEVRKVTQGEARIKEAIKLGFNKIICSHLEKDYSELIQPIAHIKQLQSLI